MFHGILFVLLVKSPLPSYTQASAPIIKAYVVVNLSAQPDTWSVKKNQPIAHHEVRNEALTSTSLSDIFKTPKNNKIEQE